MIPLRVIEEIDAKKYARRPDFAKRARNLLPSLERLTGPSGEPGALTDGVTIEVPVEAGPRERAVDADEEILDECLELGQFLGQAVTLVTGDTAMRLRARALKIDAAALPDDYLRAGPPEASTSGAGETTVD